MIILASDEMLHYLSKAKTWYIDGTFKVVRQPFRQLLFIHAFVKADGELKQLPLCFVLMTRRKARDYRTLLRTLIRLLPETKVQEIVSDFEAALWRAVKEVFDDTVKHRGCAFHWSQSVWRHLQELGLTVRYKSDDAVRRFCRKIFALQLLPEEHMVDALNVLKDEGTVKSKKLMKLILYVEATWFTNALWPPSS